MQETEATAERAGEFVQSLDRGLAVIRAFGADRPSLTLSEVARETGLSRAAARRFLHTLVELGYVGTDGREFHLRPRLLELGYAYLSGLSLPEVAHPHLQRLSDETGESSSVAVLDGESITYVARVAVRRIMSVSIGVGTRFPAFATSMGRVMIAGGPAERRDEFVRTAALPQLTAHTITDRDALGAELDRVAAQGWSLVDQELEEGLRSIAAPIRDHTGTIVAAINVASPGRHEREDGSAPVFLDSLLRAAEGIESDLRQTRTRVH
jgi:IclR family pca regulon transcriptional regulator